MISNKEKRLTIFSVFFTFFIDNLGWAIVFPIFAPYFLDPSNTIFTPGLSVGARTTLLGFFLMAFSLGQFLGAPVIGEYADRHGRKKALVLAVFFTLAGLALSAWSMQIESLFLLFLGRLITGVFSGSTSVCLTCISDLSDSEKSKIKYFGYMSVTAGVAFVIGAFLGGKLSDKSISASFSPNFPLWLAAGTTFINLLFVLFGFKETKAMDPTAKFNFLEAFQNIKLALKTEKIKRVYTIYFLFLFSWTMLLQFIPVLTVQKFSFTNSNIGDLALFIGICWAIGSGYLNKILNHYFKSIHILEVCLIGFTLFCGLVIFPTHIYGILAILGVCVILGGLSWPICTGLISNMATHQTQGKILGMSQSVQSLAMALAPFVGGMAFPISSDFPFLIGASASLVASIVYYFALKNR